MKKVLFFITNLSHGGAERVLVNLVNNLDKSKYDVTVRTIFDEGVNKQYLSSDIHYSSVFPKTFHGIKYITKFLPASLLHKLFIRGKYDVEIAYLEGPPAKIISGAGKNIRKLAWIHIELLTKKAFTEGFLNKIDAVNCYKGFNKIVCVSESVKEAFEKISGIHEDIEVKYNTNETEKIKTLAQEEVTDVEFCSEEINICSVAKVEYSKGYDRLIQVHEKLIRKGLNHHIYVLGIGSEREKLEKILQQKGLDKSFTFLGFRENPYKYVAKCDFYVCSSRREGFSTAVTEALILGIPCISTNCSGAYELLGENNEYGLVTDNSVYGLEKGIELMIKDPNLLNKYKEKVKLRGNMFERTATVKNVENMIDEIIHSRI